MSYLQCLEKNCFHHWQHLILFNEALGLNNADFTLLNLSAFISYTSFYVQVIRALAGRMNLKWKRPGILRFEDVGAKLKEKYLNATRVWFVNNTLQKRVEHDQFRAISHDDNRLVYLDPSPDYCVRNDTLGSLGMLGRTCKHYDAQETRCQSFIDKCNSCKLKYKTVAYEVEEYRCNCNFHWCCYVKCKTCKRVPYITTCTENEKFTGYYWPQWSYSYQFQKYLLYAF